MAAYAVMARIDHVDPHLTVRGGDASSDVDPRDAGVPAIDVVESAWDDRLAERLVAFGERWAQTTFFLFDPESWRR